MQKSFQPLSQQYGSTAHRHVSVTPESHIEEEAGHGIVPQQGSPHAALPTQSQSEQSGNPSRSLSWPSPQADSVGTPPPVPCMYRITGEALLPSWVTTNAVKLASDSSGV